MRLGYYALLVPAFFAAIASPPTPAQATCPALPYTLTNGTPADATKIMSDLNALVSCQNSGPGGSVNGIQYNNGAGGLAGVSPLTNGQLLIGSTGNPPQPSTLTAGTGINITNTAGAVTISSTSATATVMREFGPYAPPNASSFIFLDSPITGTAPTIGNAPNVGLVYSELEKPDNKIFPGAYRNVPALSTWTLVMRAKQSATPGLHTSFGIWVQDTDGKMVGFVTEYSPSGNTIINSASVVNIPGHYTDQITHIGSRDVGEIPTWYRLRLSGIYLVFDVSWDSQNWTSIAAANKNTALNGNLRYLGIGGNIGTTNSPYPSNIGAIVTYWDIDDDRASTRQVQ